MKIYGLGSLITLLVLTIPSLIIGIVQMVRLRPAGVVWFLFAVAVVATWIGTNSVNTLDQTKRQRGKIRRLGRLLPGSLKPGPVYITWPWIDTLLKVVADEEQIVVRIDPPLLAANGFVAGSMLVTTETMENDAGITANLERIDPHELSTKIEWHAELAARRAGGSMSVQEIVRGSVALIEAVTHEVNEVIRRNGATVIAIAPDLHPSDARMANALALEAVTRFETAARLIAVEAQAAEAQAAAFAPLKAEALARGVELTEVGKAAAALNLPADEIGDFIRWAVENNEASTTGRLFVFRGLPQDTAKPVALATVLEPLIDKFMNS